MSRTGRKPIPLPGGVQVQIAGNHIKIKGPKGELEKELPPGIAVEQEEGLVVWHEESPKNKTIVEDDGKTMYVIWEKMGEKYYPVYGRFFAQEEAEGFLSSEGYHITL